MNQVLMVIGGNWEQRKLVETAKEMGLTLVLTDPDENCAARPLADHFYVCDPRNLTFLLGIAERHRIAGVTADECDYSHYASAYIAECLGLPGDGLEAAQNTTNKAWMRERVRDADVIQPRFFPCTTLEAARRAVELIGWPVIVKPVDNRGAFGVNIARSDSELAAAFLDAVRNAHSRQVMVEAFVEGVHITVDGCFDQQGTHHNLAIASKQVLSGERPIITEVLYPADIPETTRDYVMQMNSRVVAGLGIRSGLTHSEYIVDAKERCFLVETANRGGGVLTSALIVPHMSGVDLNRLLISNALGRDFAVVPTPRKGICLLTFFVLKPGQVAEVKGLDAARNLPGVLFLRLLIKPGDVLTRPKSGAGRHGFAILEASDTAALERLRLKLLDTLEVIYAA
jgi:biotin carboxylase